ncbi:kunitz-type trypsin inhibitor-like 2 protein [Amaranthus tricolor]|uniref:kunitz-type trypsin inhibitor-like 2 protein n=1 Tax=Amaranthus tricolor TaxID=29722 RepID=UPI0025876F67|nr:kunitz-type trypsin inhibitor-like 2 protein [Amaranthus tricolor]
MNLSLSLTFFKYVITLLLFFSVLSIATAVILDTDGEPLVNGGRYFIVPQSIGIGGGLTRTLVTKITPCFYHITRDKNETFPGILVKISSPFEITVINPGLPIRITFDDRIIDFCMRSMTWRVFADKTTGQSYVVTGGSVSQPSFTIEETQEDTNVYKIKSILDQKDVGFFEKDGLLGITNEIPLPVLFKKAPTPPNFLAMKV